MNEGIVRDIEKKTRQKKTEAKDYALPVMIILKDSSTILQYIKQARKLKHFSLKLNINFTSWFESARFACSFSSSELDQ